MGQFWRTGLATFTLCSLAAVLSAAAAASSGEQEERDMGRAMMVDAQFQLALALKR